MRYIHYRGVQVQIPNTRSRIESDRRHHTWVEKARRKMYHNIHSVLTARLYARQGRLHIAHSLFDRRGRLRGKIWPQLEGQSIARK